MRQYLYLLWLIGVASTTVQGQTVARATVDKSLYTVLSCDKTVKLLIGAMFDHPKPAKLSPAEIDDMEKLVDGAYRSFNSHNPGWKLKSPLSIYRRQYVAVINGKGQKEIWINFFCTDFNYDWRHNIVFVLDGGACYFQMTINLSQQKVTNLTTNGVA